MVCASHFTAESLHDYIAYSTARWEDADLITTTDISRAICCDAAISICLLAKELMQLTYRATYQYRVAASLRLLAMNKIGRCTSLKILVAGHDYYF